MHEYLIENLNDEEMNKLISSETDIFWFPDDMYDENCSDICIEGTDSDVNEILSIIGRK